MNVLLEASSPYGHGMWPFVMWSRSVTGQRAMNCGPLSGVMQIYCSHAWAIAAELEQCSASSPTYDGHHAGQHTVQCYTVHRFGQVMVEAGRV